MSADLATLKFDMSGLASATERMIPQSKQELGEMMLNEVARPLLRKIVSITPPMKGTINGAAKKAGEALIKSDIGRIMRPASQDYIDEVRRIWGGDTHGELFGHAGASPIGEVYTKILSGGQLDTWHHARRSKSTGRVGFMGNNKVANWNRLEKRGLLATNRERASRLTTGVRRMDLRNLDLGLVEKSEFAAYIRKEQGKVGTAAGGWNDAADKLGVRLPEWIRRHGTKHGSATLELDGDKIRISLRNDVPFIDNLANLRARVQTAIDWQARDMNRRVDDYAQKTRRI